jgi:adenylosuccinate synthase
MKQKKLFTATDLGPGDGGKGGIVHKICALKNAHTVLKVGGAQGSHGVRTSNGKSFNFSHFGCGTFNGARTHITNLMVIEPYHFLHEGDELKSAWGLNYIFDYITVDANALCATPFHMITSQLTELSRKEKQKGTIGMGIGEAVLDSERYPELIIRARDLNDPKLAKRLEAIKAQKIEDLKDVIKNVPEFWKSDKEIAKNLLHLLHDPKFIERIVERFNVLGSLIKIVDTDYLRQEILKRDGVIVVESSHGILTDRYYGFHPYTSRLRTLPMATIKLLNDCDYDGEIIKLGVTRAYQIRHGAGPMVTESNKWLEKILPNSSKQENRWQGKVRIGPLDLVALRYAINVCGGPEFFDGLAVSWFDQIQAIGEWQICPSYINATDLDFFTPSGEIKIYHRDGAEQIEQQKQLAETLFKCRPNIKSYDTLKKSRAELIGQAKIILEEGLKIPLKMIAFGPTEDDKICL